MNTEKKFARRGFLGAGLLGTGGLLGWMVGKNRDERVPGPHPNNPKSLGKEFVYDVSEFQKTDPKLLLYREAASLQTGFIRPKRLIVTPDKRLIVSGDRFLKIFKDGQEQSKFDIGRPAHCLLLTPDQELLVGMKDSIATYSLDGTLKSESPALGGKTYLTSMVLVGDHLYLADAGNRELVRTDRQGNLIDRLGKKDDINPGFAVPSPYFNVRLGLDGLLKVSNPGRLRIETYTLEGKYVSSWGEPGMKVDRFCGCCNPVYMTTASNGDFVTSEKGLSRINIYDANGTFKGVVAGPNMLVKDQKLARESLEDNSVGLGFDVTIALDGTIYTLDPFQKTVRSFEPLTPASA